MEVSSQNQIISDESANLSKIVEFDIPNPSKCNSYNWLSFSKDKKEINYSKRFLRKNKGNVNIEALGIPELTSEIAILNQNGPIQLSDVADNILKRLRRYGELDSLYSIARKSDPKMSENDLYDNFYDQNDPFIDDSGFDKTFETRKPLMPESKIEDFYCISGELGELIEQGFLADREKFLKSIRKKSRKRDSRRRNKPIQDVEGMNPQKKVKPDLENNSMEDHISEMNMSEKEENIMIEESNVNTQQTNPEVQEIEIRCPITSKESFLNRNGSENENIDETGNSNSIDDKNSIENFIEKGNPERNFKTKKFNSMERPEKQINKFKDIVEIMDDSRDLNDEINILIEPEDESKVMNIEDLE